MVEPGILMMSFAGLMLVVALRMLLSRDGETTMVAGLFSSLAVAGSIAGNRLAARLPVKRLRQGYAAMVLLTGVWLWQSLDAR